MSDIALSVGTRVYVDATTPATYTIAGFEALDWTEVGEVESLGEFGGTATVTPFIPLATGITKKRKGSIDYGTAAMTVGRILNEAGQLLLKDGFDGSAAYDVHSFKVVSEDGQTAYFTGMVSSFTTQYNDANAVTRIACNIELDNKVLGESYTLFTLTYTAGANGSIVGNAAQIVASGEDGTAVYAAPAAGYVLAAWSDAETDNPRTDTNITANLSVTATFELE